MATLLADTRVRFLVAGGSAAALNWLVRIPLSLVMPYAPALIVALAIGMTYGFVIYRYWAFGSSGRSVLIEIRDFILVNAVGAAATLLVSLGAEAALSALATPRPIAEAAAHAFGIAIGAILNYLGHKRITFRA